MKELIKKCPYLLMLLSSCIFVGIISGVTWIAKQAEPVNEGVLGQRIRGEVWTETQEVKETEAFQEIVIVDSEIQKQETVPVLQPVEIEQELTSDDDDEDLKQSVENELIEEEQTIVPAVTEFVYYEPVEVISKYYEDAGRIALTTAYPYEQVYAAYFEDAAFIGDSRMMGIRDYAHFDGADFFCDDGYCTYSWTKDKAIHNHTTGKSVSLTEAMSEKQYGKVYIMLGMNDCGYGNTHDFQERYQELLAMIQEKQPNAIIFLLANLRISKEKEEGEEIFTNVHVNAKNVAIAELADGIQSFYLDYNDLFVDEEGYLKSEYTFDGVHFYADHYEQLAEFIRNHGILR